MKRKDYTSVLELTNKALELDRSNDKALWRRAEAHRHREEWEDALKDYEALYQITSDDTIKQSIDKHRVAIRKYQAALLKKQRQRMDGFMLKDKTSSSNKADRGKSGSGGGKVKEKLEDLYADMPDAVEVRSSATLSRDASGACSPRAVG